MSAEQCTVNASTPTGCQPPSPTLTDPTTPFLTLAAGYSQSLFASTSSFLGGVAFAPNGDAWSDNCAFSGSDLIRFSLSSTYSQNGATLAGVSNVPSDAGCGLANNPDGHIYSNTSAGVSQLDASSGASLRVLGQPGNALGITSDPQTGNVVYVGADCRFTSACSILSLNPATSVTTTLASLPSSQASFIDGIAFDPTGEFLFVSTRAPTYALTVLDRSGHVVQQVAMRDEPDGIAFHATTPKFVVTNDTDGNMTRFTFPNDDYSQTPTVDGFATGGYRGDLASVGPDTCIYLTQDGTNFPDGTTSWNNSIVKICPGFAPPPGVSASNRTVVLIHGIKGNFQDVVAGTGGSLTANLKNLVAQHGYLPQAFAYYQDLGYQQPGGCDPLMPPPDQNYTPLHLNDQGTQVDSQDVCDSQSAAAFNATALRDQVAKLSAQSPQSPIAIVAHSMGAAVTRGYLTLVQGDNGSLGNVDTVLTVAGAQQGSWLPTLSGPLVSNWVMGPILKRLQRVVSSNLPYDTQRPAFTDLAARSSWYDSVNPGYMPPSTLNYYNLYTDVQVPLQFSVNLLFWHHAWTVATFDSGDGLMLPGSDNPMATPALGGAKFLPYPTSRSNNHEYEAVSSDPINLDGVAVTAVAGLAATIASGGTAGAAAIELILEQLAGQVTGFLIRYAGDPVTHWNLQDHLGDGKVKVPSCTNRHVKQTPNQVVLSLLEDPANACT